MHRGDIVVLQYPLDPPLDYIKRVIGLPGDEIVHRATASVFVNGVRLERALRRRRRSRGRTSCSASRPTRFFVLGDNRPHSSDSREFGQVPRANLVGKVDLRVWPPARAGRPGLSAAARRVAVRAREPSNARASRSSPARVRGLGLAVARRWRASGGACTSRGARRPRARRCCVPEFAGASHRADLEDEEETRALVAPVLGRDGRLDVLVHAVGEFSRRRRWRRRGAADVRRLFAEQRARRPCTASTRRARHCARRAGAALFFGVAGLEGLRGRRETAAYAAAKSALLVLVRSWALEEAPHGVRVNMVSPGIVPHAHAAPTRSIPSGVARIPLGRPGTPEDVAAAARVPAARTTRGT